MRPPIQIHRYHFFVFFFFVFFINHPETEVPLKATQPEYLDFSSINTEIENSFKNEHKQKKYPVFIYKKMVFFNTHNISTNPHKSEPASLLLWFMNNKLKNWKSKINKHGIHERYPYIINILLYPSPFPHINIIKNFKKILKIFTSTKTLNVPFFLGSLKILYFQNLIIFFMKKY